jgi:hypothetical protein
MERVSPHENRVSETRPHPHSVTGREKCVVTLHVSLAGPQESMQIAVVVPNENDENAIRECGIARAKDFARQFANLSLK